LRLTGNQPVDLGIRQVDTARTQQRPKLRGLPEIVGGHHSAKMPMKPMRRCSAIRLAHLEPSRNHLLDHLLLEISRNRRVQRRRRRRRRVGMYKLLLDYLEPKGYPRLWPAMLCRRQCPQCHFGAHGVDLSTDSDRYRLDMNPADARPECGARDERRRGFEGLSGRPRVWVTGPPGI
jgi:hypothetical protein